MNAFPIHRGSALVMMLIALGLAALLLFGALKSNPQIGRDNVATGALAQARDALIGYALRGEDSQSPSRPGVLPCPDTHVPTDNANPQNDKWYGTADPSCSDGAIGRLPWRTLGIPELLDDSGAPIWYAVSGNFASSYSGKVNSDSKGTLKVFANDGTTLQTALGSEAAAIVFAPGAPVNGQARGTAAEKTAAANYLETAASINNAVGTLVANNCNIQNQGGTVQTSCHQFIAGSKSSTFNDRVFFISPKDFMPQVERRVAKIAEKALSDYYATCGYYPRPAAFSNTACLPGGTISGCFPDVSATQGRLPYYAKPDPADSTTVDWNALPTWFLGNRWDRVIYYAVAPAYVANASASTLLSVDSDVAVRRLIVMPGTPSGNGNGRPSVTLSEYLEDAANFDLNYAFVTPTGTSNDLLFKHPRSGVTTDASSFSPANPNPSCTGVTPGPDSTTVGFVNDNGDFAGDWIKTSNVVLNTSDQSVSLTNPSATSSSDTAGCFWYPTALPLKDSILRAYWELKFEKKETQTAVQYYPAAQASSVYGYGFTFVVVRGDSSTLPSSSTCGTGANLGVAGGTMSTLASPNVFLETDVWSPSTPNTSIDQPYANSGGNRAFLGNHVAILANSSLAHNNDVTAACDGTKAGCYKSTAATWMEDPDGATAATATILIGNSGSTSSTSITDLTVDDVSIIGSPVTASSGTTTTSTRKAFATALASAINSYASIPEYTACAGSGCSPAIADDRVMIISARSGTAPNGYVVKAYTQKRASTKVEFKSASSGNQVTSVKVNGVEILNATITASGSSSKSRRRYLAKNVCLAINSYLNGTPFEYTAGSSSTNSTCPTKNSSFYIQAPFAEGATPNGYPVTITPSSSSSWGQLKYTINNSSKLAGGTDAGSSIPITDAGTGSATIVLAGGTGVLNNQRVEIQTRCNSDCSICNGASAASYSYMLVKAWTQCSNCDDTTNDYTDAAPNNLACIDMTAANIGYMDTIKFGFTGGSLPYPNNQNVTISNFEATVE